MKKIALLASSLILASSLFLTACSPKSDSTGEGTQPTEPTTETPATEPTAEPTAEPTTEPTAEPTAEPTTKEPAEGMKENEQKELKTAPEATDSMDKPATGESEPTSP